MAESQQLQPINDDVKERMLDDVKREDIYDRDDVTGMHCGIGRFKLNFLQRFASIGWFVFWVSAAAFTSNTLTTYVNSQITTLERQFGFSSKQTGFIMAANDFGYLACTLFVSYFAGMVHIPRTLGVAVILFGVAGLMCCLPHLAFGANVTDTVIEDHKNASSASQPFVQGKSYNDDNLCHFHNESTLSLACSLTANENTTLRTAGTQSSSKQSTMISLVLIIVGMVIQGVAKSPRAAFAVVYLEHNTEQTRTGFYMGILSAVSLLGPAAAFLAGGIFTRMYVTLEVTTLKPRDPRWIGAWWLGFLVFGTLAIVSSIPLFFFPRRLPGTWHKQSESGRPKVQVNQLQVLKQVDTSLSNTRNDVHNSKDAYIERTSHHAKCSTFFTTLANHVTCFMGSMLSLFSNPVYLLITISTCFMIFNIGGERAFAAKYIEVTFDLPAYQANFIMAGKLFTSGCLGSFLGGYVTKRFKMAGKQALTFIIILMSAVVVCNGLAMLVYCNQPKVTFGPETVTNCSQDCSCPKDSFAPVCGQNGLTYFSSCLAGCQHQTGDVFSNCTCVPSGIASRGTCDYGCSQIFVFTTLSVISTLLGTMTIMPKLVVLIRCVNEKDKALGLGFVSFTSSLLGFFLSPIIFGVVIDNVCTIWDINCGVRGRCLLYDNRLFRHRFLGYSLVSVATALSCQVIALIYAKYKGTLDDLKSKKSNRKSKTGNEASNDIL